MMALAIAVAVSTASAQQGDEGAIRMLSNKWQQDIAKQDINAVRRPSCARCDRADVARAVAKGSAAIRERWKEGAARRAWCCNWTPIKINVVARRCDGYGTYTESYDTPQGKGPTRAATS